MKRKGLLCAILALVLLFSAQPGAMAANTGNKRSTVITATSKMPVIRVTVPTRGTVYINPLKVPVPIGGWESEDQIISTPNSIANKSDVPVAVDVTVTGIIKTGSTMTLASYPTNGRGTDKSAFIYFEITQSDTNH